MAMDDIAIVGVSFKMPQDAVDMSSLWEILRGRKNMMTEWPESRLNLSAFYTPEAGKANTLYSRGAHFLKEDPELFDAPFFSITPKEAAAMDPQQRWVLEASYRAFENAGIPVEKLKGSRTAVFGASMSDDYVRINAKDPDNASIAAVTGTSPSILANRVSWYFDLLGPSVHIDTACSSSLVAMDFACQSLHNGDASLALVVGSNLILTPEGSLLLSNLNFLSPDSVCYSFDERANGYARGEGVIAIVLKSVRQAVADGDMIRAVIRSVGSNQDGKTPSLTQPNPSSQEDLMRNVYRKAGLSFESTRYFEAHGTGTPIGDPIELEGIGRVFKPFRSPEEPLYVGSIKSNLGHLEGCSGLAGIVKSILILEKGIIAPNALFEKMNPRIDASSWNLTIPTENIPWPAYGLRRISVSSYGFGGSNAHVVLDDAYSYTRERGFKANHQTVRSPPAVDKESHHSIERKDSIELVVDGFPVTSNDDGANDSKSSPRLLVWSASDEKAVERMVKQYDTYDKTYMSSNEDLDALAFTLSARRSHLLWRTFTVADPSDNKTKGLLPTKPVRSSVDPKLSFVFTGQGAQYVNMGLGLLQYPVFQETLQKVEAVYKALGCQWSIYDGLRSAETIDEPEYSQPLCTALQVALVELLRSFNIVPNAVLGHSSGEIAAAYSIGALSLESACKISYYRGKLTQKLKAETLTPEAMLSVNLPEHEIYSYLETAGLSILASSIEIACVNSPLNCTVAGTEEAIDKFQAQLDKSGIFGQKLKTGVAYHSSTMKDIAKEYVSSLGSLRSGNSIGSSDTPMLSTVTGFEVAPQILLSPSYWAENLTSPVMFLDAVQTCCQGIAKTAKSKRFSLDFIEVGPHSALRRPLMDTFSNALQGVGELRYVSTLHRSKSSTKSILELVGHLFCRGHQLAIPAANQQSAGQGRIPFLSDCPEYPFDHSQGYWSESRLSRDFRLRAPVSGGILGSRSNDWNPLEPKWRTILRMDSSPWMRDHVVSDTILLPGTYMLLMALEAAQQMCLSSRQISGYFVKEAQFLNAVILKESSEDFTELTVHLRPVQNVYEKESTWSDVRIYAFSHNRWSECFRANIQVQYKEPVQQVDGGIEKQLEDAQVLRDYESAALSCQTPVDRRAFYSYCAENGLKYGDWFQLLEDLRWDGEETAIARINTPKGKYLTPGLVHPAVLDATIQILQVQRSTGLSAPSPANVPYQLFNAWISASGWQQGQGSSVRCLTKGKCRVGGQTMDSTIHSLADDGSLLCSFRSLVLRATSKDGQDEQATRKLLYGIEWKPQMSFLNSEQLHDVCGTEIYTKDESTLAEYRLLLELTLSKVMKTTLRQMSSEDNELVPDYLKKYVAWMKYSCEHESSVWDGDEPTDSELSILLDKIEELMPNWKIFPVIARSLKFILQGKVDPLQLAFDADMNLAEMFYADAFDGLCDNRFQSLLELATHENPTLRIIEVGAGTGGWTRRVLSALHALEQCRGATTFSEYDYTDISPSFFEKARINFSDFKNRMNFKPFDLERNAAEQDLRTGSYDLVIAGSVLHATADLAATIRNIRTLLKPGGRLIMLEPTVPQKLTTNFAFGVLPGWWLGNEEWRSLSPTVDEATWDQVLRENGFSGNDLVLRDYESDACHLFSIMVSTAENTLPNRVLQPQTEALIVTRNQSEHQTEMAEAVRNILLRSSAFKPSIVLWDDFHRSSLKENDIVICLLELDKPFLCMMEDESFQTLQSFIQRVRNVLWVSSTTLNDSMFPLYGLTQGFLRSMRSEAFEKHIVTLVCEAELDAVNILCEYIAKVLEASFQFNCPELEYYVRDGLLTTGRLVEEARLNDTLGSLTSPRIHKIPWSSGPPVKLTVDSPGVLDSFCFVEDSSCRSELGPTEVEAETKAWGLSFRDVFVALGRLEGDDFGYDCSGVVKRVGPGCKRGLKPGDRVCMNSLGCMRTYCRADEMGVVKIPADLSLEQAASIIGPGITAYHSLMNVARLQWGEKILIHSASGSTGQMALWIAKWVGAEIFATVGLDEKKQFLVKEFGIPPDHIFYSRNTSFAQGVMRVTNGYGVDVVLNSLAGDGLKASWECVAPYGRFIEIGKADIMANGSLPMAVFAKNVSFSAIDLHHIAQSNMRLVRDLLYVTMNLFSRGIMHHPKPLSIHAVSEVETAFRYLQSGKSTGRIVISVNPTDVVQKRTIQHLEWKFEENASYIIAGGLGGLGRAIIKWMAGKGAKNLIIPSRSGPSSRAARDVLAELEAQGIRAVTPKCDVSVAESLSEMLDECRAMPPIKGCINAAMVLQDSVFENMTIQQWKQTVTSKVQTSWNLHQLLPRDLDFFVFLSSLAGIYGSPAQSNYAAGCAYQDSLARYRVSHGEKATSLDIGWMRNIGIIAETERYQQNRKNAADMGQIEDTELLALLNIHCDPSRPVSPADKSQLLVGVVTPADFLANGEPLSPLVQRPLFSGFGQSMGGESKQSTADKGTMDHAALFRAATATSERAEIVVKALAAKLARALGISPDDVEPNRLLSDYGVDSLMAVELRNWIGKDFRANVAVFDIMGGATVAEVGELVASRAEAGK